METLDNILSGKGEAAPEPEPRAVEEKPVAETQPADGQTEPQDEVIEQNGRKMVPLEALTETRGKVKRYTEQVADFERRFKESDAAWERRFKESETAWERRLAMLQPRPEPKQPLEWFDNPDAAFLQRGEELIGPVVGRINTLQSELAQMRAERVFGDKYQDFISLVTEATRNGDPEVRVLAAMMEASPRPYEVAKEWFERRTFDPAAKEAEIKAKVEAEILEKYGIKPNDPKPATVQSTVMPTPLEAARNVGSRSGPAWGGPTPLGDIFKR